MTLASATNNRTSNLEGRQYLSGEMKSIFAEANPKHSFEQEILKEKKLSKVLAIMLKFCFSQSKKAKLAEQRARIAEFEKAQTEAKLLQADALAQRLEKELNDCIEKAKKDTLTPLYNQSEWIRDYTEDEERRKFNRSEGVVYVSADVDFLKKLNDQHGHHGAGDPLLKGTGNMFEAVLHVIQMGIRPEDEAWLAPCVLNEEWDGIILGKQCAKAYHPSGDEFWIRFKGVTVAQTRKIVQRLQMVIENNPIIIQSEMDGGVYEHFPRISFGIGTTKEDAEADMKRHKDKKPYRRGDSIPSDLLRRVG